jgi:hypothetical protein
MLFSAEQRPSVDMFIIALPAMKRTTNTIPARTATALSVSTTRPNNG